MMELLMSFGAGRFRALSVQMFVCLLKVAQSGYPSHQTGVHEFCNAEEFEAKCGIGFVVHMDYAKYGNMKIGRCLRDPQYIKGCSSDVLSIMDTLCSGRSSCRFRVPENNLNSLKKCPMELAQYLEASYSCLPVVRAQNATCTSGIIIRSSPSSSSSSPAAASEGYITNSHQVNKCKWIIWAEKGQQIRLTLHDFGLSPSAAGHQNVRLSSSSNCQRYAVARDLSGSKSELICSGANRIRVAYQSTTNGVEVETFSEYELKREDGYRFILKYEAVGCSDPVLDSRVGATFVRDGKQAFISCNFSDVRTTLECRDKNWVGEVPACQSESSSTMGQGWGLRNFWPDGWSSSHGLLTVIVIGVALGVILGVLMLAPVLIYFRRRDLERRAKAQSSWPEGPELEPTVPRSIHTGYNGLSTHEPIQKQLVGLGGVARGVADGGLPRNSLTYYDDNKTCVYNLRNTTGPSSTPDGLAVQGCFITTTVAPPGCRWAATQAMIGQQQDCRKENLGDYEYPN